MKKVFLLFKKLLKNIFTKKGIFVSFSLLIILFVIISSVSSSKPKNQPVKQKQLDPNAELVTNMTVMNSSSFKVSGIKVESIADESITAKGVLNNNPVQFIINTDNNTSIFKDGKKAKLSDISVNDPLNVMGSFQSFSPTLTLLASDIKVAYLQRDLARPQIKNNRNTATTTRKVIDTNSTTTETQQ